jgi:alcohol dehydrogenase class IV
MDALTQLIEPLTSLKARPDVDPLCEEGIRRVARSLRRSVEDGRDAAARADLLQAAFLSGVALSHAGLGAVHGLAGPVGGLAPAPHGRICARLLPVVTAANLRALAQGRGRQRSLDGYARAAEALGEGITDFCAGFPARGLRGFGFTGAMIPAAIAAATSGSMKTNPVELAPDELAAILTEAL